MAVIVSPFLVMKCVTTCNKNHFSHKTVTFRSMLNMRRLPIQLSHSQHNYNESIVIEMINNPPSSSNDFQERPKRAINPRGRGILNEPRNYVSSINTKCRKYSDVKLSQSPHKLVHYRMSWSVTQKTLVTQTTVWVNFKWSVSHSGS